MTKMKEVIHAEIVQLSDKMKWPVVFVPMDEAQTANRRTIPVIAEIDGESFQTTLLKAKRGTYFVFTKEMKAATGKMLRDIVSVVVTIDHSERTVEIDQIVEKELLAAAVMEAFLKQPDYLKREQQTYILSAKKEETKQNRIQRLIEKLQ